ncbi:hypothetical protein BDR26DRAFT_864483 [Obelidium mucronatum]|nr:hypothetical protein BDR26DRAFT_864483 [Obelidium mucronatum]
MKLSTQILSLLAILPLISSLPIDSDLKSLEKRQRPRPKPSPTAARAPPPPTTTTLSSTKMKPVFPPSKDQTTREGLTIKGPPVGSFYCNGISELYILTSSLDWTLMTACPQGTMCRVDIGGFIGCGNAKSQEEAERVGLSSWSSG